jgi:phosphoribosylformylglycinamidine (FGAM) synthase-like enzyme
MGGSEYARLLGRPDAGHPPKVDAASDKAIYAAMLELVHADLVSSVHDCSRGGLAVALAEMSLAGGHGAQIDLGRVPSNCRRIDELVFSESHGRFVVATSDKAKASRLLREHKVPHAAIGEVRGHDLVLKSGRRTISELDVTTLQKTFEESLPRLMD